MAVQGTTSFDQMFDLSRLSPLSSDMEGDLSYRVFLSSLTKEEFSFEVAKEGIPMFFDLEESAKDKEELSFGAKAIPLTPINRLNHVVKLNALHNQKFSDRFKAVSFNAISLFSNFSMNVTLPGFFVATALTVFLTPVALKAAIVFGAIFAVSLVLKRTLFKGEFQESIDNIKKACTFVTTNELEQAKEDVKFPECNISKFKEVLDGEIQLKQGELCYFSDKINNPEQVEAAPRIGNESSEGLDDDCWRTKADDSEEDFDDVQDFSTEETQYVTREACIDVNKRLYAKTESDLKALQALRGAIRV